MWATVRDQGLSGVGDDRVAEVAASESRVLVTLDVDFGDIRRRPPVDTPGGIVIRLHRRTLGSIRRAVIGVADLLKSEPITGRLWVVDESRVRVWPEP